MPSTATAAAPRDRRQDPRCDVFNGGRSKVARAAAAHRSLVDAKHVPVVVVAAASTTTTTPSACRPAVSRHSKELLLYSFGPRAGLPHGMMAWPPPPSCQQTAALRALRLKLHFNFQAPRWRSSRE